MKIDQMVRRCLAIMAAMLLCTLPARAANRVVIVQTNSAGDNVHIIAGLLGRGDGHDPFRVRVPVIRGHLVVVVAGKLSGTQRGSRKAPRKTLHRAADFDVQLLAAHWRAAHLRDLRRPHRADGRPWDWRA